MICDLSIKGNKGNILEDETAYWRKEITLSRKEITLSKTHHLLSCLNKFWLTTLLRHLIG